MDLMTILYMANATLLLLHEIESAYEKEWDILRLPGGITGFLLMHIPIIFVILYGLIEIAKQTLAGFVLGLVLGVGGIVPFIVHKMIVKKENHFNLFISNVIIYSNVLTGIGLSILSARAMA
jgi:hypothetical protein